VAQKITPRRFPPPWSLKLLMDAKTKKADDHDGHESGNEAILNDFGDAYDPN